MERIKYGGFHKLIDLINVEQQVAPSMLNIPTEGKEFTPGHRSGSAALSSAKTRCFGQ